MNKGKEKEEEDNEDDEDHLPDEATNNISFMCIAYFLIGSSMIDCHIPTFAWKLEIRLFCKFGCYEIICISMQNGCSSFTFTVKETIVEDDIITSCETKEYTVNNFTEFEKDHKDSLHEFDDDYHLKRLYSAYKYATHIHNKWKSRSNVIVFHVALKSFFTSMLHPLTPSAMVLKNTKYARQIASFI